MRQSHIIIINNNNNNNNKQEIFQEFVVVVAVKFLKTFTYFTYIKGPVIKYTGKGGGGVG